MARASQQEKRQSRERILQSAARLVRERGLEGASVGEVMKDAGLTHGGFYRHFDSKDAMIDGALGLAFADILAPLAADTAGADGDFRAFYLSDGHLANVGKGCPAAALAGEIARAPGSTQQHFGKGIRSMLAALARAKVGDEDARTAAAARELAMLVGALALARACDAETAGLILSACRTPETL